MNAMPLNECKLQQYQIKLLRSPCKFGHDGLKTVRFRCDFSSTVLDVLKSRGWLQVEGEDESWNLFWCEVTKLRTTLDNKRLEGNQRVPHFRNHYELTRKNLLAKNLKRLRRQCVKEGCREDADMCDCMPVTYELPGEYMMFVEEYRKESDATWIVKPSCGSQGRGIFLFQKLKELTDWRTARSLMEANTKEVLSDWKTQRSHDSIGDQVPPDTHIVQRYIDNPYLIAGRKFDLRIYVLVTSFSPLKVWIGREGFARLSNKQFSLSDLSDSRVHLTNSSIQLRSDSGGQGCKWSMRRLREFLTARHGATTVETLVQDIARVVLTSLRCVQNVIIQDRHCFELYGYDVLLDCNLKPWLIEVNASPSLSPTSDEDYKLKYTLLQDVLNVLDLEGRLTGHERRVGGFDLIWDDGPVWALCPGFTSCDLVLPTDPFPQRLNIFLGCLNNREQQLIELEKFRKQSDHLEATQHICQ